MNRRDILAVVGEFERQETQTSEAGQLEDFETFNGTHITARVALSNTVEFHPHEEEFSLEIGWFTAEEIRLELAKGRSWIVKKLSPYNQYSVRNTGTTGRPADRYPFWVLDELKKEVEAANAYPDAGDHLGIETMARMLGHTADWVSARLTYLHIEGQMMLDKQKRLYIHYPPETVSILRDLPEDILLAGNYNRWTPVTDTEILDFFTEQLPDQRITYKKISDIRKENKSAPGIGLVKTRFGSIRGLNEAIKYGIIPEAQYVKKEPYIAPEVEESDDDNELGWQIDALCAQVDPEAFFPEKGGSLRMAKKICEMCDVKEQCLNYALENNERFGVWGGLSERERRKLERARQAA